MKYAIVLLFIIGSVLAAPSENADAQAAQFGYQYGGYQNPMMGGYQNPMGMGIYGGYDNLETYDGPMNPSKYLNMKNEDFGIDYSLSCSSTCGCRQSCMIIWWQPCYCRCPPPCPTTPTTTTTTPTTTTTTTTTTTERTGDDNGNGNGCNNGCCNCSCQPCVIWWMCPRPCGPSCCGGSSNCCNGSNNSCCGK